MWGVDLSIRTINLHGTIREVITDEYKKVEIAKFNGLYKRGMADECPPDHAICCENVIMPKVGEVSTRPGTKVSFAMNHPVKRMWLATFNDANLYLLTLDYSGNLYKDNDGTPIYSNANMVDFFIVNLFNKCFILPLGATFPPPHLQVWRGPPFAVRDAAGLKPTGAIGAAGGAAGGVDPGIHKITVSFETDTGFITPPDATITSYIAPGALKLNLSGIPVGPPTTVARHILVTRGNEELFFFVNGGRIADNTTTTLTLDFFDSDLVISADYLFDLLEVIPGGIIAAALSKYHGRLVSTAEGDLVRISRSGDPESMNNVDGFVQIPAERDGNIARGICIIRDILYITKSIGIFASEDNGDVPSSWSVRQVDGGVGAYQGGISSITASQPSLSNFEGFTMADRGGIHIFNGAVSEDQPLTWKIDDLWQTLTHGAEYNITIAQDPFNQLLYVLMPTNGSMDPNFLLVGDYSVGMNWKEIKWSIFFFPFVPSSIGLINFQDSDGLGDYDYYLRIGTRDNHNLYKLHDGYIDDSGTAITSFYQHGLISVEQGALNVYAALRHRARGVGSLLLYLYPEDMQNPVALPPHTLSLFPGFDYFRQCNFTGEKVSVYFGVVGGRFTVNREDLFGKRQFMARPA